MNRILRREIKSIATGIIATFLLFVFVYAFRLTSNEVFLFIQIITCSFVLYLLLLVIGTKIVFFQNRELLSVLIAFTIVATLLLNIDRSRSFFVLKWVSEYSKDGEIQPEQLILKKNLGYLDKKAIQKRIEEQIQSQTISINDKGQIKLTMLGQLIVKISTFIAKLFHLKGFLNA